MSDELTPKTELPEENIHPVQPLFVTSETTASPMTPPSKHTFRNIFVGADGLRAGWSILLFVLFASLIAGAAINVVGRSHRLTPPPRGSELGADFTLLTEGLSLTVIVLAAWVVSRVEKRSFSRYGLGSPLRRLGQFALGCLWGFLLLSLLVGSLWMVGALVFTGTLLAGSDIFRWGVIWSLAFLCVSLLEEFLTRGFLQFTLARGLAGIAGALGLNERSRKLLSFWIVALFFSFVFGLGHKSNPGESPLGLLSAGLIGLVFAFSLWRTGSLWWAVGYHATWDWAQSFLYGVRDSGNLVQHHWLASHPQGSTLLSGGLTGPEGSIFILGVCALTAVVVALTLHSEPGSPSDPAYRPGGR